VNSTGNEMKGGQCREDQQKKQAEREVGKSEDKKIGVNEQRAKTGQHRQERQAGNRRRQDEGGMGFRSKSDKGNNRTGDRGKRSKR
jgi:hypothetical protein